MIKSKDLISRIIVFLALVVLVALSYQQYNVNRYNEGINLNRQEYVDKFYQYQQKLLDSKKGTSYTYSLMVTFLGLLIIVGGYEAIVLVVKFLITYKKKF